MVARYACWRRTTEVIGQLHCHFEHNKRWGFREFLQTFQFNLTVTTHKGISHFFLVHHLVGFIFTIVFLLWHERWSNHCLYYHLHLYNQHCLHLEALINFKTGQIVGPMRRFTWNGTDWPVIWRPVKSSSHMATYDHHHRNRINQNHHQ